MTEERKYNLTFFGLIYLFFRFIFKIITKIVYYSFKIISYNTFTFLIFILLISYILFYLFMHSF